jgi:hypothetical protein
MKLKRAPFILFLYCLTFSLWANAQVSPNGFGPGPNSDMWTSLMVEKGLYTPHVDDCISGEAFQVIDGTRGFCIEQSERTADSWINARSTCFAAGKRLPELTEYRVACGNAGSLSLSNVTNDYEWAGNAPESFSNSQGAGMLIGNGGCAIMSYDAFVSSGGEGTNRTFRCVR